MYTYFEVGGNWIRRKYSEQCGEMLIFGGRCQGCKGHEGDHWCYSPDGSYCFGRQPSEVKDPLDIASGITPPDHKTYIHPKKMSHLYYNHVYSQEQVEDPALLELLNNDGYPDDADGVCGPVKEANEEDYLR